MASQIELLAAYKEGMLQGLEQAHNHITKQSVVLIDNYFSGPENRMFQAGVVTIEAMTCVLLAPKWSKD